MGVLAELVAKDAKAPRGVAEALSGDGGGEVFDEIGPEGLVLAVGGVGAGQEDVGQIS